MIQYRRIGELLFERKLITQEQLDEAVRIQLKTGKRFGEILVSLGAVDEGAITECLAEQYDFPIANLNETTSEPEALDAVGKWFAMTRLVLPIKITPYTFDCVISDPLDVGATDVLMQMVGRRLNITLAPPTKLYDAIRDAYGLRPRHALEGVASDAPLAADASKSAASAKKKAEKLLLSHQPDRDTLLKFIEGIDPEATKKFWSGIGAA
jgi:hypothetical protein